MNKKTFLIFGRESAVCAAEIFQYFGQNNNKIDLIEKDFAYLSDDDFSDNAPNMFGGIIKSGLVFDCLETKEDPDVLVAKDDFIEYLALLLEKNIAMGQKFHFGLSFYGNFSKNNIIKQKIGIKVKKFLKEKGYSIRYVESRNRNLSSVDVVKNKLINKGMELCVFGLKDNVCVGVTKSVQPFSEYSKRDYTRPARNARRGMLPPKLAKSLINITSLGKGGLLADLFCGSGTVLQEALLLDKKVYGSDIDSKAVSDSLKNLAWLEQNYSQYNFDYSVEQGDVLSAQDRLATNSVGAVVSEFDLGPALRGNETKADIQKTARDLAEFYAQALKAIYKILKPGARLVAVWPYFVREDLFVEADFLEKLWHKVLPIPEKYKSIFSLSKRNTLIYGRDNQHIFREILILEKK